MTPSELQWGQIHFEFPISNQNRSVFKKFITETQSSLYLLQERRSSLISAAVTGKIDVRNYAPSQEAA